MTTRYRKESLGRMAVFLLPSLKLKARGHDGLAVEDRVHSFLIARFAGYTVETGNILGFWRDESGNELYGEHRLFRTLGTDEPIYESFVTLHYPPFWHYDVLQALVVLERMGLADDPRASDGLDLLEERGLPDGRWRAGGRWWKAPGKPGSNVEVVDWGSGPSELLTLNALRVLRGAGRR